MKTTNDNNISYIFCISTGRSGTGYLQTLFGALDKVVAVHEPRPRCNQFPMRASLNGNRKPLQRIMPAKIAAINAAKGENHVYVETSHCFIKGFGWEIPEYIPQERIGVIILARNPSAIVESFMRIRSTPLTHSGDKWQIRPSRRNPITEPPGGYRFAKLLFWTMRVLSFPFRSKKLYRTFRRKPPSRVPAFIENYERRALYWYVQETEALAEEYIRRFPRITFFQTDLAELNDKAGFTRMIKTFGLDGRKYNPEIVGVPVNQKADKG